MAHHVYHTRALVMRTSPSGEADMAVELFTEDFGRILTRASGLRREASRLRYIIQPMSFVKASVVRGRTGWRLTTANPDEVTVSFGKARRSLARVTRIVQKFFPYDIASQETFHTLLAHASVLVGSVVYADNSEAITLKRLFRHLGYWSEANGLQLQDDLSTESLLKEERERMVREINRILRTVHT
jgi:recombinational DNA repair protein (RecF pathway)